MGGKTTPTDLSNRVAANLRRLRKMRRWSAQELADRMEAAGCPVSRQVIANRESNHVVSRISVDELFAFAAVFERSVMDLIEEEIQCARCGGSPPTGFGCLDCEAEACDIEAER